MQFNEKNKVIKKRKIIVYIFLILVLMFIFITTNEIFAFLKKPGIEQIVLIPNEGSVRKVSSVLKENKIISSPTIFNIYSRFKNYKEIKSGKFKLKTNMKYDDIFKIITNQNNVIYDQKLTIIEGSNFFNLKEKFSNKLNIDIDEIIKELNKKENYSKFSFAKKLGLENLEKTYFPMEGFILPYTFPIHEDSTPLSIARDILKKSDEKIKELEEKINKSNMNLWEIFTLASVIQSETDDEYDMKRISSVFYNRMKINKRLESDVTTLYSKKIEKDAKDKNIDKKFDGYDTYKIKGLPTGPICFPSMKAIDAAINPSNEDYYYFYADKKKGKILYEKDFESHKKNYTKN